VTKKTVVSKTGASEASAPSQSSLRQRDAQSHIDEFLNDLRIGTPWFDALLGAISRWDVPAETVGERDYRYLFGNEAFDWLVLAERLCAEGLDAQLLPSEAVDALLLEEEFPAPMEEDEFKDRLGAAKYRAHLNFTYGVRLEEALQLGVEERIHKERSGGVLTNDRHSDPTNAVFRRIYGSDRDSLLREFRAEMERPQIDRISLTELREFTYWVSKRRVAVQDPARVASDTRQAMLTLQRLQELKRDRLASRDKSASGAIHFVDTVAVPTT
jgi:hypothetical protein